RLEERGMNEVSGRNRFVAAGPAAAKTVERKAIPLAAGRDEPLAKRPAPPAAPPPAEVVEQGRALALTSFDPPAVSAGERLIRLAYRLGVPGQALVAPFRKPARPRLLATVESPLGGDPVAGTALRAGH